MKAMSYSKAAMRVPADFLHTKVKGSITTITCAHSAYYHSRLLRNGKEKRFDIRNCREHSKMSNNSKRAFFQHTPSMGNIGHDFTPGRLKGVFSLQAIEEDYNVLNFAESFSTSTTGIPT